MRYKITSRISNYEAEWELEIDNRDLIENIDEIVNAVVDNTDLLNDAFTSYMPKAIGYFSEQAVKTAVYENAKKYIDSLGETFPILLYRFDGKVCRFIQEYDIKQKILGRISDQTERGDFDAFASQYVENCLEKYVSNSQWHVLKQIEKEAPILWFGPTEVVENLCWAIDLNEKADLSFWFESDPWCLMEHIGDFSECFLTWYVAECGCWAPDMDDIRQKCPIRFDEVDTTKSILEKILTWCDENRD